MCAFITDFLFPTVESNSSTSCALDNGSNRNGGDGKCRDCGEENRGTGTENCEGPIGLAV